MSGVEFIVGAVLGAVPVAVETYDRSKRVFQIFSTFRHYPREVKTVEAKIGAQRAIFRNNAINLLDEITKDRSSVQHVMNRSASDAVIPSLTMATAYHHRLDALRDSFTACHETAEQMQNTLQKLCDQLEEFVGETRGKHDNLATSEWLRSVKTRFKLGLNKPHFGETIEELRGFNRDFESITTQITRALRDILQEGQNQPVAMKRTVGSLNVLQKYHRIRHASRSLYSALQVQWICSSHNHHSFDMRIVQRDSVTGKEPASVPQNFTYKLAVTGDASKSALRLEVEQSCKSDEEDPDQSEKYNPSVKKLESILKENAERPIVGNRTCENRILERTAKQRGQQMHYVDLSTVFVLPSLRRSITGLRIDESLEAELDFAPKPTADLPLVLDLCSLNPNSTASNGNRRLLGCLKAPQTEWFFHVESQTTGTTTSLSQLIRWISEEPILRSLPRPRLVHLASSVAEGIMQFYSTPWLTYTNLGQNVRYLNQTEPTSSNKVRLDEPFFMARLENPKIKGQVRSGPSLGESCSSDSSTFNCKEARNKLLFNFGILLLEIGYSKPWHELKESVSKTRRPKEESLSDYQVAERLAHLLINQMGLTYPKIIKKCLGCDFGLGETDMANEDLQRHAGVITPASLLVEVSKNDGLRIPYTFHGMFWRPVCPTGPIRIIMKYDDDSQLEFGKPYRFEASSSNGRFYMTLDSGVKIKSHVSADPAPDLPKITGWGRWTKFEPMIIPIAAPIFLNINIVAPAYSTPTTDSLPSFFSARRR
ncbi:hypothetical protein F53441_12812 [Fusarium austroafricanum]|uniref:DUF7580 domain-containing protein n=1 Tax=Fusarium austroafricanum TaxID=2364996 RepID=A0A8H4JVQ6_9HYPO|nr:hypothetical protein F53441_12812 [Fusarium austroafricanum]